MTQHNTSHERTPWYFHCGVLLGLLISVYYSMHQILTGDQIQMLQKGYLAAHQNIWLHYGNAASTMGNVPGSLSTLLVALPLKLYDSPFSPMLLLIILRLAGFLLFDSVIRQTFPQHVRILFLILCWLNPWFQFESLLYNPSYLFFCSALHFWSAFNLRDKAFFSYSMLHVLSIGLAAQLHYSWPILFIISTCLILNKKIKINWLSSALGIALILISLLPYYINILNSPSILHSPSPEAAKRYIGWGGVHIYPVMKSLVYWLRYASFLYPNKLITGANFDWLTDNETIKHTVVYLWRGMIFIIGGISIIIAVIANKFCLLRVKSFFSTKNNSEITSETWMLFFISSSVIAVLISAALSPIVLIYWHLMLVFPFALFPILLFSYHKITLFEKNKTLILLTSFFIIVNLIAINDSKRFCYEKNYIKQTELLIKELHI